MTELELKRYHVDSIAQYKVLKHISEEFIPEGIASLAREIPQISYMMKTHHL